MLHHTLIGTDIVTHVFTAAKDAVEEISLYMRSVADLDAYLLSFCCVESQ